MCNITKQVEQFLDKYDLKNAKTPLLVGFSGGFDSLCLLNVLLELHINTAAIHLNHNWRGEESTKDMEFCKNFCKHKGVPFYTETLDETVPRTETSAREARYEFFERAGKIFHSDIIFTAHNADDNAETVLYRIIKGSGVEGLCAIAEHRGIFYRPLLNIYRNDIEKYCLEHNLKPNIDSSNADIKYKRNLIRHKIFPLLKEINKDALKAINSLSEVAKEESSILCEYLHKTELILANSTNEFVKLTPAMQNKIIYNMFKNNKLDYDRTKILDVVKFINASKSSKSGKTMSITEGLWIFANSRNFRFITKTQKNNSETEINGCGQYEFDGSILTVEQCLQKPEKYPPDSEFTAYISTDNPKFTLRYRKDGDVIHPLGAGGVQKLKKYFNSKKIPNYKKDTIPLLCRGNEVLWAVGFGISDHIKVENQPSYVLKFTNK